MAVKQLLVEDLLLEILQFLVQAAYLFIYEGCSSEVFELATFPEVGVKRSPATEKQLAVEDLLEFAFATPDDVEI